MYVFAVLKHDVIIRYMLEKAKKSIIANTILAILVFVVGFSAFDMISQSLGFREEAEDAENKVRELTMKKEELEAYLRELETPEAAEREAKERLNLKKKGEEVVVVVPKEEKELPPAESGFWEKIKSFFSGIFLR